MPNYGDPEYWDKRYRDAGDLASFDWLESYASLHSLLQEFLTSKDMRILVLGCGNADFSEDLYDDGYTNVVNVDISSVVIGQMQDRNLERPLMEWKVMDVTDMSEFESNSFDLAIDKSTIDALLCGDDSFLKVAEMLKETQRVLKVGGTYFAISYGKPESRTFHFVQPFLSMELREFILYDQNVCTTEEEKAEKSHYIYACIKNEDADEVSEMHFEACYEALKATAELERQEMEAEGDESEQEELEENGPQHAAAAELDDQEDDQVQSKGDD